MKTSVSLAALFALVVTASAVQADKVYRWVDDEGVTHFTAHPPKDRDSRELRTRTGHSEPVDYSQQFPAPDKEETGPGQRPGQSPEQSRDTRTANRPSQAQLDEACQRARQNLQVLEEGGRIAVEAEDGSPRYLTDQEKTERMEQARRLVQEAC